GVQVGALGERAAPRLASRRLDLDDLGAEPAEHLSAARPCLVLREVQHHDPIERLGHAVLRFESMRTLGAHLGPASRWCPTERARRPFARPPRLPPRARGTWGPSRPPATLCPTEGRPGLAGPSPRAGALGRARRGPRSRYAPTRGGPASPGRLRARGVWGTRRGPRSRYAPTRGGPASPGRLRARGVWGTRRGPRSRYAPTRGGPASPGRLRARGAWGALLGPPLFRSSKPRNESSMRARDSR